MGVYHRLAPKLQQKLIEDGRSYKIKMRAYLDEALAAQATAKRRKEEIVLAKNWKLCVRNILVPFIFLSK